MGEVEEGAAMLAEARRGIQAIQNEQFAHHQLRLLDAEVAHMLGQSPRARRELEEMLADFHSTNELSLAQWAQEALSRIERDRGQVFVELRRADGLWEDKDAILQRLGIARSRHANDAHGAWTGYQLSVQADDVRRHLPLLRQYLLRPA